MKLTQRNELKDYMSEFFIYVSIPAALLRGENTKYKDMLREFDNKGLSYYKFEKSPESVKDPIKIAEADDMLAKAVMSVIVLSDETLQNDDENVFTMYEAGVSIKKKLYFVNELSDSVLDKEFAHTPVRDVQLSDVNAVKECVFERINLPKDLYDDANVNYYAQKRILYVRFNALLDVKLGVLRKIMSRFNEDADEDETCNETDALSMLEQNLSAGTTLFNFGKDLHLKMVEDELWLYKGEIYSKKLDFSYYGEYAKSKGGDCMKCECPKVKVVNSKSQDELSEALDEDVVAATLEMKFACPNHEVLGVSFLPFLQINSGFVQASDVLQILADDGICVNGEGSDVCIVDKRDGNKPRIYFLLNVEDYRCDALPIKEQDGKGERETKNTFLPSGKVNYFFPK